MSRLRGGSIINLVYVLHRYSCCSGLYMHVHISGHGLTRTAESLSDEHYSDCIKWFRRVLVYVFVCRFEDLYSPYSDVCTQNVNGS